MMRPILTLRRAALPLAVGLTIGIGGTLGTLAATKGSSVFSDVPSGIYYDDAVGEMYSLGIIKGFEDGKFHPDEPATRGQIAVMMQRLRNELKGITPSEPEEEEEDDDDDDGGTQQSSRSSKSSSSKSSSSSLSSVGAAGAFRFTVASMSISEQVATVKISVLRTGGNKGEVKVDYETAAGTATAGEDFTMTNGTVTFADGESSKLISINLKDDATGEGGESFTVTLKNPTNSAVMGAPSTITVNLIDNESGSASSVSSTSGGNSSVGTAGALSFNASAYAASEEQGTITVKVVRTGGTQGSVDVHYATSNGTGRSGEDYTATSGTLTFAAGETTKSFTVTMSDDSSADGNKTVNLTLSNPTNTAVLGSPSNVILTIIDNEAIQNGTGSLRFSHATYNTSESQGNVTVTVQRVGGSKGTVSVQYDTVEGTARAGQDYTTVSGTLTFEPGESGKTFKVPILSDSNSEGEENLNLTLGNVQGNAPLVTPFTSTINIQ